MSINTEAFDKHSTILYKDLSRLFWGSYPYKVVLRRKTQKAFRSSTERVAAGDALIKSLKLTGDGHKVRRSQEVVSIFFLEETDVLSFIDRHADDVVEVTRPTGDSVVNAMRKDRKVRVRPTLFYNRYRWVISFKCQPWKMSCTVAAACDDWLEAYFGFSRENSYSSSEIEERALYNYSSYRKLYVNSLADVVAVKLALHDYVSQIEYCVLQDEVEPTDEKNIEKEPL